MSPIDKAYDDAKVHLSIFDEEHVIDLRVRVGPTELEEIIAPARTFAERVSELAVQKAREEGKNVTCVKGCAACCRHVVAIASIEAVALAKLVAAMPPARRKKIEVTFANAIAKLERAGLIDAYAPKGRSALLGASWDEVSRRYFDLGVACPFLAEESCSIYADRPLICREYLATTPPSRCDRLDGGVETVARPVRMSEVLAVTAHKTASVQEHNIPLVLALEWARVHGAEIAGEHDGEELFHSLMQALEEHTP
jgi:Fe-S-cluster containining protein